MTEKPRPPRRSASDNQHAVGRHAVGDHGVDRLAELEAQLSKSRQDCEKAAKISRSLAKTCNRAEQELRRREEVFNLLFRHGSDLVFRVDRDGKFLEVSSASRTLLGQEPAALVGRAVQDFVAPEDLEVMHGHCQAVLRQTKPATIVLRFLHKERGAVPLEVHCRAVPHPQTQMLEVAALARLVTPAWAGNNLAFSLAHELNQPLTSLSLATRACGQLVRDRNITSEELAEALDDVADQAERACELVQRLRQLAARGKPQRSAVDVEKLIRGAVKSLEVDLAGEKVAFHLEVVGDVSNLWMDRIQIEQVLINLIRNALEAMEAVPVERRLLTITATRQPTEVVVAIADTGRGLTAESAERLFQPNQSTKSQGVGLGLVISQAILQAHAGRLWVEPAHASGATFCFALPLARES